MIPATPAPGTSCGPLVTVDDYVTVTQDTAAVTAGQVNASVLADAVETAEYITNRTLGYGQYTERLYVNRQGMVYPSATPIDQTNPPSNPVTSLVQGGAGIWIGYFTPLPDLPVWTGVVPPQTDVTYYGGFQPSHPPEAGPTPALPNKLTRAICKLAWYAAHPTVLPGLPAGVKSVSVDGVSLSGDLSIIADGDPALWHSLKRWRRLEAKSWDS